MLNNPPAIVGVLQGKFINQLVRCFKDERMKLETERERERGEKEERDTYRTGRLRSPLRRSTSL